MTKWPIHQEDITIKNKYAHNKKYLKQKQFELKKNRHFNNNS